MCDATPMTCGNGNYTITIVLVGFIFLCIFYFGSSHIIACKQISFTVLDIKRLFNGTLIASALVDDLTWEQEILFTTLPCLGAGDGPGAKACREMQGHAVQVTPCNISQEKWALGPTVSTWEGIPFSWLFLTRKGIIRPWALSRNQKIYFSCLLKPNSV